MYTLRPCAPVRLSLRQTSQFCHTFEGDPGGKRPAWVRPREHGPLQVGAENVAAVALRERYRCPGASSVLPNAGGCCLLPYLAGLSLS